MRSVFELPRRLADLHRELGIPASYAGEFKLPLQTEADEDALVNIGVNPDGRPLRLTREAASAWAQMRTRARHDGVKLIAISAFRSVARQAEIIREKQTAGSALPDILRFVAAPGFSEHHTGRALDIGSPEHIELDEDFERTAAFAWLQRHAGALGFRLTYPRGNTIGIGYEPWHWCWSPQGADGPA